MLALLPPSSRRHRRRRAPTDDATARPPVTLPVKTIFATRSSSTSAAPLSRPPVTTLITPGGRPASTARRASSMLDAGVISDGLRTSVFPAARAGAAAIVVRRLGEFHGVMTPTTP